MKFSLVYTTMRDWIQGGRVGPLDVTEEEAKELGLGDLLSKLKSFGESPLELLAGPMVDIEHGVDDTHNVSITSLLDELDNLANEYMQLAAIRLPQRRVIRLLVSVCLSVCLCVVVCCLESRALAIRE